LLPAQFDWLLLIATLFAGAVSPGPSLALVIRTSLAHGRSAGVLVGLAHGLGVWLYALAVVLGVATLLVGNPWLLSSIQIAGIVFLAYLGSMMLRGGVAVIRTTEPSEQLSIGSSNTEQRSAMSYPLACPFIIGPHDKLGFLEGETLEEAIYRRTDGSDIEGSRRRYGGSRCVS